MTRASTKTIRNVNVIFVNFWNENRQYRIFGYSKELWVSQGNIFHEFASMSHKLWSIITKNYFLA